MGENTGRFHCRPFLMGKPVVVTVSSELVEVSTRGL
jgi:hypothetical protein